MASHSKQRHSESPLAAEEWQLQILQELHKKKPRPTVEQRKLLATQTGLDVKWIARWFKRVNNGSSASKGKLKTGSTVGCHLSRSQTAAAIQSIDGSNPVKSPSENLVESTTSGQGTGASPGSSNSIFSDSLDPSHTFLFSRSGAPSQVAPENGRSTTDHGQSPYHSRLHPSGWELEHHLAATVTPQADLELERYREQLERPLFYPHFPGANLNPVALPRPHTDHHVDSQLRIGVIATNSSGYLASQALSPFRHSTSSPNAGTGIDNVKSGNPHNTPSSPPVVTVTGILSVPPRPGRPPLVQTPTRYVHVNPSLVPERSESAFTGLEVGYPRLDLGCVSGAGVRAGVTVEARPGTGTHIDLSPSQAQAVPGSIAPTGPQLGPSESSAPPPSMYYLLFDKELDSVVIDREQDDDVPRSSSSRGGRGGGNDRMLEPHVTPTPISFFAKWEDMLALERRVHSSSYNMKLVQSKRIRAVHAVEPIRTKQQLRTDPVHCGQGRDR